MVVVTAHESRKDAARILEARIMRIGWSAAHGFREGSDARDAGLSGGWALGYGGGRGSGWRRLAADRYCGGRSKGADSIAFL
jgi:hypothetical protein